jgi:hypothetical protein
MLCIDQGKGHRLSTQHPYSVAMNQYFLKEPLRLSDLFENQTDMDSELITLTVKKNDLNNREVSKF